jgi:SAM-dependent methyltransferase
MDQAYHQAMAAMEDEHWWFAARRRVLQAVLDGLHLPASAEVLEVGCGSGGNLPLLARYGRLFACEPDDASRAYASRRALGRVAPGSLPDDLPFGDRRFDLIALFDVLEHVADDEAGLRALRTRLKPGGRVLLTVPAYRFLWSGHDVVNHHHRRYTRPELVEKLRRAGLQVHRATYFNTVLFPAVAAVRLLGKLTGREGSNLHMPSAPVNALLERLFAAERRVVTRTNLPFGVSVLAVAERQG